MADLTRNSSFYNVAQRQPTENVRRRTLSTSLLDPYENPVVGLDRVNANPLQVRRQDVEQPDRIPRHGPQVAGLSSKFESLNYEICENQLYKDAEKDPRHPNNLFRISRNRWVACFFIGVFTAFVGVAIDILVKVSTLLKFGLILSPMVKNCDADKGGGCMWMVMAAWMAYNCGLVLIATCLVVFVSEVAAGSGIPQIKCYLNGIEIPEVTALKTLVAKSIGVSCAVGGGLCAGKEGPMIHSGGVIGAGISQGKCASLGCDFGLFKEFRNDHEKRDFVAAGAAAGVAAAFGAPIGGVLFSLEEGASFWNQSLTWRMFFSAMISSFTLSALLTLYYKGTISDISWNGLANFGVFGNKDYKMEEIPFFLLIGVLGGCSGALFNHVNHKIALYRKKYVKNKWQRIMEALLVAAVSAFAGFATIYALDDCVWQGSGGNDTDYLNQFYCPKGKYSAAAQLYCVSPEEGVRKLFHDNINSYHPTTLAVFAVEYFILSAWTFGLSVPSGVFIPGLLTGAAWGRLVGIGVRAWVPGLSDTDPGKYALMGAAAQLGGMVRMTISLTAILLEATKDITFGLPIMLVLMITKWVGDIFNEGLYDTCIELAEVPLLGWHPPKLARNINASQVMRPDVVAMARRTRVGYVLKVLETTEHHAFPVVDLIDESTNNSHLPNYGRLKGIILRSQLLVLLKKRAYLRENEEDRVGEMLTLEDFADEDNSVDISKLDIAEEDHSSHIDLSPYMHPHPHRVPLNASLPFIYKIFRGLGLRYLLVVNEENRLRGVVTRKDVARYRTTGTNDLKMHIVPIFQERSRSSNASD